MLERKQDAAQIRDFMERLTRRLEGLNDERRWWPKFVYHYTDIRNAVSILKNGCLLCRTQAERSGTLSVSSGSKRMLAGTEDWVKDYVRLYFRPKTPTQWHAEGIRSRQTLAQSDFSDAHCPTPVFFLFDAVDVLTRQGCQFSDGGLYSSRARLYSQADELMTLPWEKIYHEESFDRKDPQQADIPFRRNAEIITPGTLDLDGLKWIRCRSEAERQTLLALLDDDLLAKYAPRIMATARNQLFFCQQTFVDQVWLSAERMTFRFSPDTKSPGPFQAQVEVLYEGEINTWSRDDFAAHELLLTFRVPHNEYHVRLWLDGHLAYANGYINMDQWIPF